MNYQEFLQTKKVQTSASGFEVNDLQLNRHLFDFQKFIVKCALKAGRYAIFADCGLGKTLMQLEWANQVAQKTNRWVLILAPLAVTQQTIEEGKKFGIYVQDYFEAESTQDLVNCDTGIAIANYEQLDNIECRHFSGIVIDESSILKNFEGAYRNLIIDGFKSTPYKLACTATPSPNDPMELGNHSEFLNVMSRNEMLAMYFTHDGGSTSKWRLKGHSIEPFWDFVSKWSIMLSKPSDIGFDNDGYDLPELHIIERQIETEKRQNWKLFNDIAVGGADFNKEVKLTIIPRIEAVADIVNGSDESFIIWIKHNEEGERVRKLVSDAVEVKGKDSDDYKKGKLLGFAKDEFRVLLTKTKIAQFGLNYQNCHNQIFASFDFSFEALYQAIRRSYRFGQKHPVNIYLITTDTMQNVVESIRRKQVQFEEMQKQMTKSINKAA